MFEIHRTPKIVQHLFPKITWTHSSKEILLTFDDGPDPVWSIKIAEYLNKFGFTAIFFVVGDSVTDTNILTDLHSMGHKIGWHSEHHTSFLKCSVNQIISELEGKKRIEDILSEKIDYFRFPYGHFLPWQIKHVWQQELIPVMWSYMIHDYKQKSAQTLQNGLSKLKENDILLFHDKSFNIAHSFEALKNTIKENPLLFSKKINIAFSNN